MLYVRILMFQSIKLYFINEEDKGGRYWIYQKVNKTKDKRGGLKCIFEIFVISSKLETCIEFSSRQTSVVQRFWTAWPSGWFSTRIQSQDVVKLSETGNQSTTNCFRSICNYHVNYWHVLIRWSIISRLIIIIIIFTLIVTIFLIILKTRFLISS